MTTFVSAALGLFAILFIWLRQRPAFIAGILIIYSLAYRVVDTVYMDLSGPIYATELERYVGGNGATAIFVLSCLCFLVPLALIASQKRIMGGIEAPVPSSGYLDSMQRIALAACVGLIALLYLDMLRLGVIPLFEGIDRLDYDEMAGILHRQTYQLNFLLSAVLGTFTVLPRLRGRRYSLPFIALVFALLLYWALTGNRFSAFLVTLTYFALPFAAVVAMQRKGVLQRLAPRDAWSALVSGKTLLPLAFIVSAATLTGLVINSYYSVRNYADPLFEMSQRIFVQPVQLWASTWETVRLDIGKGIDYNALDYVFVSSPYVDSNSTIRFLMERELGYFRANELIAAGQQYAGGYPEIFFILFGFWRAIPLMLLLGCSAAFLLYLAIRSLAQGRVISAIFAVYLYYGFCVAYLGGMLNFILVLSYWLKIFALVVSLIAERYLLTGERANAAVHTLPSTSSLTGPFWEAKP
jgi:hypothetical protein